MYFRKIIFILFFTLTYSASLISADIFRVALPDGKIVSLPYFYINNAEYIDLLTAAKLTLPLSISISDQNDILYKNCIIHYQPGTFFINAKIQDTEKAIQMILPVIQKNGSTVIHLRTYFELLESLGIYKCEFYRNRAILRNMLKEIKPEKIKIASKKTKPVKTILSNEELASMFINPDDYRHYQSIPVKKEKVKIAEKKQMTRKESTKEIPINPILTKTPENSDSTVTLIHPLSVNADSVTTIKQQYPPTYYSIPKTLKRKEIDSKLENPKK